MPASNWVNGNGQVSTSHDREHNHPAIYKGHLLSLLIMFSVVNYRLEKCPRKKLIICHSMSWNPVGKSSVITTENDR